MTATLPKPCLGCGEPVIGASRCLECRRYPNKHHDRIHPHSNSARWKRLSQQTRKRQPFCLDCAATENLCADHIIPVADAPDLAYVRENVTVRCKQCNGRRAATCTDAERQQVLDAIATRKARAARYLADQQQ